MDFVSPLEFQKLPRLYYAVAETVADPSYRWTNADRESFPQCVFQYTLEGHGMLSYGGRTYPVGPGQAFIFDLTTPGSSFYYPPGATKPWSIVGCVFLNFEETVERMNARHGPVYDFGANCVPAQRLITMLDHQKQRDTPISNHESYTFCAEIVGEMCRLIEEEENGANGSLAFKARDLIYQKRMNEFSLETFATSLGVCPQHLCREFKRRFNSSPKQYHSKLRAAAIAELLRHSGKPIKEVADAFGFSDLSYFNKFFKKHYQTTPGQFRTVNRGSL